MTRSPPRSEVGFSARKLLIWAGSAITVVIDFRASGAPSNRTQPPLPVRGCGAGRQPGDRAAVLWGRGPPQSVGAGAGGHRPRCSW